MACVFIIFRRLLNSLCYKRHNQILPNNDAGSYDNNIPEYLIDEINEADLNEAISKSMNETPSSINNITEINNGQRKIKKKQKKCPICLENIEENPVKCKNNKCKASYHNVCIKTWKETKALVGNKIPCLLCTLNTISIPNRLSLRNFGYPGNRVINRTTHSATHRSTHRSTDRPAHRVTHIPTDRPTHRVTHRPTDRPTHRVTHRPTDRPTHRVTHRPTHSSSNNFRDYNYDNILNRPINDRSSNRNINLRNYNYENNSQSSNVSMNYRSVYPNNTRLGNRDGMNNSYVPQSIPVH
jgi:hypothetical protein